VQQVRRLARLQEAGTGGEVNWSSHYGDAIVFLFFIIEMPSSKLEIGKRNVIIEGRLWGGVVEF
jgi:hypothetical protein